MKLFTAESPARVLARIVKRFPGGGLDVDFAIGAGFTILFGASGAGKTTLLDCLSGLVQPEAGGISIDGRNLFSQTHGVNVPVAGREDRISVSGSCPVSTSDGAKEYRVWIIEVNGGRTSAPLGTKFCNRFESRSWLSASRVKFQVVRVSGSRWPAPWLPILACCCWTSRWPHWTRLPSRTSSMTCGRGTSNTKFPSSTLRIAARRCLPWASVYWCSRMDASLRTEHPMR